MKQEHFVSVLEVPMKCGKQSIMNDDYERETECNDCSSDDYEQTNQSKDVSIDEEFQTKIVNGRGYTVSTI